uniref:Uncharacterized protein n=1 Tax=Anguilla anguilla TaxID=7936 RepID=A0A0E9W330_ANGAN
MICFTEWNKVQVAAAELNVGADRWGRCPVVIQLKGVSPIAASKNIILRLNRQEISPRPLFLPPTNKDSFPRYSA